MNVYDGHGERVSESVGLTTTKFLVDMQNPTALPQVMDETVNGSLTRTYAYGLQRISENQLAGSTWTPSFYGYDGHGNVRFLTSSAGTVTNTYQYDAFGRMIASSVTTPNNFLYSGEWSDSLGLYNLRARYYNQATGRFMTMDPYEGCIQDCATLHKYVYTHNDPVNRIDPSGKGAILEYEFSIGDRNFKFALHPGHHYWTYFGRPWYCLHLFLATWTGKSDFWSDQYPILPICLSSPW